MKIGVVGAGMVGSTATYATGLLGEAREIVLVDVDDSLAAAQAEDISHAMPFAGGALVRAGAYAALEGAGIVVLAAGVAQKPREDRLSLLARNAAVFDEIIGQVLAVAPDTILLIATNPVDIMTSVARRLSGLPAERVIGSGTILDTARFRSLLGRHLSISPQSLHAYVLGEHGDSEVLAWSSARAGNMALGAFAESVGAPITEDVRAQIDAGVRNAAYTIIDGKGFTNFGIGAGIARIVKAIARDQRAILSVSAEAGGVADLPVVAYSVPRVLGAAGVIASLTPALDPDEHAGLAKSAALLAETAAAL